MKKIIALSLALAAAPAFAADIDVCTGLTAAGNGTVIDDTNSDFVVTSFTPKCSANVYLSTSDNATTFAVGAGSAKGKSYFAGNTEGGAVAPAGTCASTGCTQTDASGAASASLDSASAGT